MSHVSHKLKNSIEGALAGGGDPATSPLYVFGPFLKLIVIAGVAQITFGASVWLVVITITVVSAMYRLVMQWVTDGSGGSGLSEEEFGGWAVKVNAAITFIEYTLTFLVSMAAMVTFIADRLPVLNETILGLSFLTYRTIIAIALSVLTGWLVNRGPQMAARTFGPATAGVLLLLWAMVIATILKRGLHFPDFNIDAFRPEYLHLTLGGYVRILAVMTGVEVFANLVAAYDGTPAQKSNKAFYSLLIIMGTTAITMLVVGPVIYSIADPTDIHVSVFTQAMDYLLPSPLPYFGTLIGIAVLMSASAASAQGLQNLALGLKERRYIPPRMGEPNQYAVADLPVWIEVGIVCFFFLALGTHEETYLAIYAAGVFILLSMTGWAVTKRLLRNMRASPSVGHIPLIFGTIIATSLTSGATIIIFTERFLDGAWTYLIFIPMLYAAFTYFRKRYGDPTPEMDYLGQLDAAHLAGFGFGQVAKVPIMPGQPISSNHVEVAWHPDYQDQNAWYRQVASIPNMIVLLDGSENSRCAIPIARMIAQKLGAKITLLSAIKKRLQSSQSQLQKRSSERMSYLNSIVADLALSGVDAEAVVEIGSIFAVSDALIHKNGFGLVITATRGDSGEFNWLKGGLSHKLVEKIDKPILLVHVDDQNNGVLPKIGSILVALDGSTYSERALPYARLLAKAFDSHLTLLCVSAVPEAEDYRAPADIVLKIRQKAEASMYKFLNGVARLLRKDGLKVDVRVTGSIPAHAILAVAKEKNVDMLMLTSQGRGGYNALLLGSVAEHVVQNTKRPVFMVPIQGDSNEPDVIAGH
ncbi:MAG: universal stress protein [Anaerolineales bacterium]|nr:universal stress protein [Anaerolineales bacterium]